MACEGLQAASSRCRRKAASGADASAIHAGGAAEHAPRFGPLAEHAHPLSTTPPHWRTPRATEAFRGWRRDTTGGSFHAPDGHPLQEDRTEKISCAYALRPGRPMRRDAKRSGSDRRNRLSVLVSLGPKNEQGRLSAQVALLQSRPILPAVRSAYRKRKRLRAIPVDNPHTWHPWFFSGMCPCSDFEIRLSDLRLLIPLKSSRKLFISSHPCYPCNPRFSSGRFQRRTFYHG